MQYLGRTKISKNLLLLRWHLLLCICILTEPSSFGASISGTVFLNDGTPAIMAHISIENTSYKVVADENGSFKVNNIAPGNYGIAISYVGANSLNDTISVHEGSNQFKFVLQQLNGELNTIEITGKSAIRETNEQAYEVTAISAKALYNNSSDVKQILDKVPGVRIQEDGGLGSNMSFSLNGFSGDQVKFFIDGIPMDNFGSSLSLNNIPVNMIEQVEVYKGVVPVWLGTDALGGAVNIVTNKNSNFLDASYSFGSFNTHRTSINGAFTNSKSGFTIRGSIFQNYSDNNYKVWVPVTEGIVNIDSAETERFHDRYRSATVRLEAGFVNKKYADQLLFGIIGSLNDQQVQNGVTMSRPFGGITKNSKSVIPTMRYSKSDIGIKGLDVSLYGAYNLSESQNFDTLRGVRYNWLGDTTYTPGSDDAENSRTLNKLNDEEFITQFNVGYQINPRNSLALNYSYNYLFRKAFDAENPEEPTNKFPKSLNKQIVGLAYKFDFNEKWSTTIFSKGFFLKTQTSQQVQDLNSGETALNQIDNFKENYGYGLASSYFVTSKLQVRASFERTARMPQPTEIFGDGLFVNPSPDLGPERSNNLNAGILYELGLSAEQILQVQTSFIYRDVEDLIRPVVSAGNPNTRFENLAETRNIGVEGSLNYRLKKWFHLGVSATFQDITDQADSVYNESTTGTGWKRNFRNGYRIPNIPYFFGNANAGFTFDNVGCKESVLQLNYNLNYVEQYFLDWAEFGSKNTKKVIPRQISHSVEASYSLKNGKYNIALECRNLTDARLYDKYYLQKPGRAFYIKLRYAIGRF